VNGRPLVLSPADALEIRPAPLNLTDPAARRRAGKGFAGLLEQLLAGSDDPTDAQLLAAIGRWKAGDLA